MEEVQPAAQRSVGQRLVLRRSVEVVVAAAAADQAKGKDQPPRDDDEDEDEDEPGLAPRSCASPLCRRWADPDPALDWSASGPVLLLARRVCHGSQGPAWLAVGRSQTDTRVGCMVWSTTASSSVESVSRSICSRSRPLKASAVLAAS